MPIYKQQFKREITAKPKSVPADCKVFLLDYNVTATTKKEAAEVSIDLMVI